jgi:RimJ/RimL family protein N-acetyltransferase
MNSDKKSESINNVFTIECEDIILREYSVEDLDEFHAITHQPGIVEFLPGWNVSKEQRLDWLLNYEGKENKEFIKAVSQGGDMEELHLRLGIISKDTGEFKGYTTQAAQGLIKYLFENTNVDELTAIALMYNKSSNKVIQKCGFDYLNIIELENEKYNHYKLNKSKWRIF